MGKKLYISDDADDESRTMPPRFHSNVSAVSVFDWSDNDAYVSTFDAKVADHALAPLTKSLRFSDEPHTVFLIPHLNEFTEAEISSIWFEPNEYANMKNEYKDTLFLMECNKTLDEVEHTARGLEYRTQEGAWARYENKRDAYNAVLDEQDIQWKGDYDDDEALRRVYLEHSTKCSHASHELANKDAREAKTIYDETADVSSILEKARKSVRGKSSLRRLFSKGKSF